MKKLSEYNGKILLFAQPSIWKSYYELRCNTELIATLEYKKFFSETATIDMFAKEKFEIKSTNFWRTVFEILEIGKQLPYAVYEGAKWKQQGVLSFYTGGKLKIVFSTFRKSFELLNENDVCLVRFVKQGFFKSIIEIHVIQTNELLDKHMWISLFSCFLSLQYDRHKSAAM